MFKNATDFNQDLSSWDVSKVENMSWMFSRARYFNNSDPTDNSIATKPLSWNVQSVTDMNHMFHDANRFNQEIVNWNTSAVTNAKGLFTSATVFNNGFVTGGDPKPLSLNMGSLSSTIDGGKAGWRIFRTARGFNQELTGWTFPAGRDLKEMFKEADAFLIAFPGVVDTPTTEWFPYATNQGIVNMRFCDGAGLDI